MTEFPGTGGGQAAGEVTGLTAVAEEDRPHAFAWVILDDNGDPARPSSLWRYRIDPLPSRGSRVRQRFTHGPGASYRHGSDTTGRPGRPSRPSG